jgi:integrase
MPGAGSEGVRPDEHPVLVYLNRLSPGSRRAMGQALRAVVAVYTGREAEAATEDEVLAFPWKGFFEECDFERVLAHLPEDVRPLVRFLWLTGWRKGEALGLQWRNVDFVSGTIRIEETKSGEPGTLPFHALPELDVLLHELRQRTTELERARGTIIPRVFHRESGHPIRDLRRAWVAATKAAGVPGRILHDFRRTAVRRMERAGVPRSVAMKISGHKTESIYRRYAIVAERDIADGLRKVAAFQRRAARASSGGQMGHSRVPSWVPPPSQVVEGVN